MSLPESAPPSRPAVAAHQRDLSEAEFAELGGLLAAIPEPLDPFVLDEADGFIAGIAVQAAAVPSDQWLRFVFDAEGHRWGEDEPSPERARASTLLVRREQAVRSALAEFGSFDPWLADAADADDPVTATVAPWVAGFLSALDVFPLDDADEQVEGVVSRLERYLTTPMPDRPPSIDTAITDVMLGVFALYQRSEQRRYRVEPVQRDAPKVGRNEPCPCGSGRKFKQCHGAPGGAAGAGP